MTPLLAADNLRRAFSGVPVVEDFQIALAPGQILGLLGPNGAGKSTALQMLTGVLRPDFGQVWIKDINLYQRPLSAKRHIGYAPDVPPLYPAMTVDDYLHFCARLHGLSPTEARDATERVKTACQLTLNGQNLLKNLSLGFQQRVNLAQALVHDPDIMILDEPTNALDPEQIERLLTWLKHLAQSGRALILSSHRLTELEPILTDVIVMQQGRIQGGRPVAAMAPRWRLRTHRPIDRDKLMLLPGLQNLFAEADNDLILTVDKVFSPESLATLARQQGWELIALEPVADSLARWYSALIQETRH